MGARRILGRTIIPLRQVLLADVNHVAVEVDHHDLLDTSMFQALASRRQLAAAADVYTFRGLM